jgi:hypothetical protein
MGQELGITWPVVLKHAMRLIASGLRPSLALRNTRYELSRGAQYALADGEL